jgi:DNA-binding HxlR family transcriptional regulator
MNDTSRTSQPRSGCPVSLGLDIFGDRWTLLIIRDLMFSGKRHYREMLHSDEHISSNILADRLQMLLAEGVISKAGDPSHAQKVVYSLTEKGIALLPVVSAISDWSYQYRPVGADYFRPAEQIQAVDWAAQMAKLRKVHLGQAQQHSD